MPPAVEQLRDFVAVVADGDGVGPEEAILVRIRLVLQKLGRGESYRYTSGVPLETPSGFMEGEYEMKLLSGERFQATIPIFSLDSPFANNRPN